MRNAILALMITVLAGAVLYLAGTELGYLLGFPAEWAKGLAGLPLGGIKSVYEFLETNSAKRASAKTGLSPTTQVEFSIHPIAAFLLSLITWSGVILFTGGLMGALVGVAGAVSDVEIGKSKMFAALIVFTSLPLRAIAAVYLGSWIGTRSRRYVFIMLVAGIALGQSGAFFLSNWMLGDEISKMVGDQALLERYLTILPDIAIFILCGALGYRYGQRQNPTYYLAFIMRLLPEDTRNTIVAMARDEAMRARPPALPVSVPEPSGQLSLR